MEDKVILAEKLLRDYRKDKFSFGIECLNDISKHVMQFGKETLLIISQNEWAKSLRIKVRNILNESGIKIIAETGTSAENTPLEDVLALADFIISVKPKSIVCVGGGSAIDCAKAANILASLDPHSKNIESFFGADKVSEIMSMTGAEKLYPLIAVQVAAGSGSHITKYANVTNIKENQKKIIIDNALIPDRAVFDYLTTLTMPLNLTLDGAMDGFSHCLESYYGVNEQVADFKLVEQICLTGIELIISNLPALVKNLNDKELRRRIGIATDLGAYAITLYGTNGAHLNSYNFVDILTHGKICAILNPYYTVFFSTAIEDKLKKIALIYEKYISEDISNLGGRKLGIAIAKAMAGFSRQVGFPIKLSEIKGFNDEYIKRSLNAAKNPQLKSKLENMPIPLKADEVDEYMGPVLEAAKTGDFNKIKTIAL